MEKHFGDADQRGVEVAAPELLGELRGWDELNLALQPARERHGVEIRHGTDAERREGVFEFALALHICAALLALDAVSEVVRRLDGGEAEFGEFAGCAHAEAKFDPNACPFAVLAAGLVFSATAAHSFTAS